MQDGDQNLNKDLNAFLGRIHGDQFADSGGFEHHRVGHFNFQSLHMDAMGSLAGMTFLPKSE